MLRKHILKTINKKLFPNKQKEKNLDCDIVDFFFSHQQGKCLAGIREKVK
jgi:hypothetical protein